jgi:tripartite-type tricarboxylate transporter receptor subunit TctC
MKANKIRGIALSSRERFPAVPEIPTFHESGLPGYEASTWFGMLAPSGTPMDIVRKVNSDVAKVLARQDVKEKLTIDGQLTGGQPPEDFAKFIREEIDKYTKVIQAAKVPQQ